MHEIKLKCPAKINLTLEVLNKRPDGFHNIKSIMQTIDLFDILTINIEKSEKFEINLTGTSNEIPYNEKNLVYKAILLFAEYVNLHPHKISVHIEKNIPIAAGLAGGSTDAAGTLLGLNHLFDNLLPNEKLHALCSRLGSDLNFCLEGGCQLATSRGEILEKLPFKEFSLSLIKPKNLGISAKEAYEKFSQLLDKPNLQMAGKFINASKTKHFNIEEYLHNDLEVALINDYQELKEIKNKYPKALMSGSGSTFFILNNNDIKIDDNFWVKTNLMTIPHGVSVVKIS